MMGEAPRKVGRDRGRDRDRAAILHRNLQKIYYLQMEVGLSRQVTLRVKIRIGKSENDSLSDEPEDKRHSLLLCKSVRGIVQIFALCNALYFVKTRV
jgi:hypothetical protein